jgi:hypothetical protein
MVAVTVGLLGQKSYSLNILRPLCVDLPYENSNNSLEKQSVLYYWESSYSPKHLFSLCTKALIVASSKSWIIEIRPLNLAYWNTITILDSRYRIATAPKVVTRYAFVLNIQRKSKESVRALKQLFLFRSHFHELILFIRLFVSKIILCTITKRFSFSLWEYYSNGSYSIRVTLQRSWCPCKGTWVLINTWSLIRYDHRGV